MAESSDNDSMRETSYRELLSGIARHEEAALAAFYDATAGRVYGLALRITRQAQAAEEVVSDVYFQVWNQAHRYEEERGRVLTWLLTICRSRALDLVRRRDQAELHADPHTLRPEAASDEDGPLDLLLATERSSALHAALQELNPAQRHLLALAFFRGLTHEEISVCTGMPLGSVKTSIRKAMHILKDMLHLHHLSIDRQESL